jgi:acetolactate synthase-1/2/3 large subunit
MAALWKRSHPRTGGRLVVDALRAHGVDTVFCVPGESYLAILDALYDARDEITVVTCRHEHGAADMAEAYGKLTGRPGVCLVTRGPGACNASIGVHTAFQDSTPMVMLVGQVERPHLGREAFQEVDFTRMFAPLAKHAAQADRPDELPGLIAEAFHLALSHRPGPVVLALPEDVLAETAEVVDVAPLEPVRPEPDPGLLERLHHVLGDAERPLMIIGGGAWSEQAREDIGAFVAANNLPTCCSFRRHDIVDNRGPNFVGEMGIGPNRALIERAKRADLLLAVGTRLGDIVSQGYTLIDPENHGQALVHVHPDPEELGRVFEPALAIPSGMAEFAAAVRAMTPVVGDRWRDWAGAARADYVADRTVPVYDGALDLGRLAADVERLLTADAVVTVDAGNFAGWPQRFVSYGGGRRLLGAANGAMGYGVPAAVAAKIADPERMVVAFVGDGGFGMTGQELSTALHYGVAPVILVFNNGMYGTIRMHQERTYPGRIIATRLVNPDFAALARAYGAHGETVERTEQFAPAFERSLASGKAAVIELITDPEIISTRTTLSAIRRAANKGE